MQNHSVLKVENVCKRLDGIQVLDDVSFCLYPDEILGIVGGNASSKTTLIRAISGDMPIDSGDIVTMGGGVIRSEADARANGIAVLHEDIHLYNHFSVAENVFFSIYSKAGKGSRKSRLLHWSSLYQKAQKLCDEFEFDIDVRKKAGTLGFAEKQIVALLHALTLDMRILIIDDAFSALGSKDTEKVMGIIRKLKDRGIAVLFLTPSLNYIKSLADSIIVIKDGKTGERMDIGSAELESLEKQISEGANRRPYPKLNVKKGTLHMECRGLYYEDAIKDVSFKMRHGEILGIVGAAGSGRTTLARLLGGDLQADGGSVILNGTKIALRHPADARKHKIAVLLDDREQYGVIPSFSLEANLVFPTLGDRFTRRTSFLLSRKDDHAYAQNAVEKLAIQCEGVRQDIKRLSAGNQQKVLLARALAAQSEILVLDEPTRGIDTPGQIQIYNLLNEAARIGKSIILITSNIAEAIGMCDHILVLRDGMFVGEWTREEKKGTDPERVYRELYSLFYEN